MPEAHRIVKSGREPAPSLFSIVITQRMTEGGGAIATCSDMDMAESYDRRYQLTPPRSFIVAGNQQSFLCLPWLLRNHGRISPAIDGAEHEAVLPGTTGV